MLNDRGECAPSCHKSCHEKGVDGLIHSCNLLAVTAFILAIGASVADASSLFEIEGLSEDGVLQIDNISEDGVLQIDNGFWMIDRGNKTSNDSIASDYSVNSDPKTAFDVSNQNETASANSAMSQSAAHLGWGSFDPAEGDKGRHAEYGRRVTDLIGVFSIEMNIKLGSDLSCKPGDVDWMPCL